MTPSKRQKLWRRRRAPKPRRHAVHETPSLSARLNPAQARTNSLQRLAQPGGAIWDIRFERATESHMPSSPNLRTPVCRNAEHKVCSIVRRPRAPQETIAPMVRATRPPARRTRGPRFGHVPHLFGAIACRGAHDRDAPMPHELRLRSLARADRHARLILTYEAAGVPSLAASRGRTERRCRVDCWRSRGSRARRQRMLLQAAGPQRRGIRFGAAAPPAGSWSARRCAERARAGAEL